MPYYYSYLIIHNFHKKAKPRLVLFYYFLFCPFSRRIFQNFDFFFRYFTEKWCTNCCTLPDMVLAAGLGDPAQLVGCHQLFEVVHPLPQHLTLVGVLYKDAMIFGF